MGYIGAQNISNNVSTELPNYDSRSLIFDNDDTYNLSDIDNLSPKEISVPDSELNNIENFADIHGTVYFFSMFFICFLLVNMLISSSFTYHKILCH